MKPLRQKLPLNENSAFVAQTFRTPKFEVDWHRHIECELILLTEGAGMSIIGNDIGEFETGDIYLLGANLPHTFQKKTRKMTASAMVVHFKDDCWGNEFLQKPELRSIKTLLAKSRSGLKITGETKMILSPLIKALETARDVQRFLLLIRCLDAISRANEYVTVSTLELTELANGENERIEQIFKYILDNFRHDIKELQVAKAVNMSKAAFSNFFKKSTQKTYIDFLNEVRIGNACSLLTKTDKNVETICYDSGYSTLANFHKQFKKLKKTSPLQYRLTYGNRGSSPQGNIHTSFEE